MTLAEWARISIAETLPPLRRPPAVRLLAHQDVGARRLLLLLRRLGGALLFDEVGMGKSFTAAAVAREWQSSGAIAAAVPAPLLRTWHGTLARFGVEAAVVSHDSLPALPSLAGGSLLIVDEAHRFRNVATRRHRRLGDRTSSAAVLLVTATPLCNRLDDILALVRIAFPDDVLKAYGVPSIEYAFEAALPDQVRSILALLGVRREPGREVVFPGSSRNVVRFALGEAGEQIRRSLDELEVPLCDEGASPSLVRSHLHGRLESSPDALRASLERQQRFYRRAREKLREGFELRRRDFAALFEREERELFQELLFPDAFLPRAGPGVMRGRAIDRELQRIDALLAAVAEYASEKFGRLDEVLSGAPLPAIVFTRSIATARRLWSLCKNRYRTGLASSRGAIDGSGADTTLDKLLRAFRARSFDVLILTDLASEGLDLQAAGTIVHFDLPWTAVKLDQRNGRAIRIGQVRDSVTSIYFVPARAGGTTPIRFVSRKGRLAARYLHPDPFSSIATAGGIADVRVGAMRDALVVVAAGVVCRIAGDGLSADPRLLRSLASEEVEPRPDGQSFWRKWRENALLVPSRVGRTSPQGTLARSLSAENVRSVLPLLGRRYRSGTEAGLARLGPDTPVAEIEGLLRNIPIGGIHEFAAARSQAPGVDDPPAGTVRPAGGEASAFPG